LRLNYNKIERVNLHIHDLILGYYIVFYILYLDVLKLVPNNLSAIQVNTEVCLSQSMLSKPDRSNREPVIYPV
jgi:hypothetical protein